MSVARSWDAQRAPEPRVTRTHVLGVASRLREEQGQPGAPGELPALLDAWIATHPREWEAVLDMRLDHLVEVVNRVGPART